MNNKTKILIVEDEMLVAQALKKMVEEKYQVSDICSTYHAALKSIAINPPDAVLLDVTLQSSKSGLDLAEYLKSSGNILYILLTASDEDEIIERILALYPHCYFVKPVQKVN